MLQLARRFRLSARAIGNLGRAQCSTYNPNNEERPIHQNADIKLPYFEGSLTMRMNEQSKSLLTKTLTFSEEEVADKVQLILLDCPKILRQKLIAIFPEVDSGEFFTKLIMLSGKNFRCPIKGRRACIEVGNELNLALSRDPVYFLSYFAAIPKDDDGVLYIFNEQYVSKRGNTRYLYANVEHKAGVVSISDEESQENAGPIYVVSTRNINRVDLLMLCAKHVYAPKKQPCDTFVLTKEEFMKKLHEI